MIAAGASQIAWLSITLTASCGSQSSSYRFAKLLHDGYT